LEVNLSKISKQKYRKEDLVEDQSENISCQSSEAIQKRRTKSEMASNEMTEQMRSGTRTGSYRSMQATEKTAARRKEKDLQRKERHERRKLRLKKKNREKLGQKALKRKVQQQPLVKKKRIPAKPTATIVPKQSVDDPVVKESLQRRI
jgi:hypothetical protein